MKFKKFRVLSAATIIIVVIAFVAFNFASRLLLQGLRFDATEDNLYTLSAGTENIISALDEPVRLKFFYSSDVAQNAPGIQPFAQRTLGLLRQYALRSGGKVTLENINPEAFSPEEDQAVSYGLQAVPLDGATKIYLGLVAVNSVDRYKSIPFISLEREAYFEYDATKLIYELEHPDKPGVAIMSWLPIDGKTAGAAVTGPQHSWVVYQQLSQQFSVTDVATDAQELPDNSNILLLVHPDPTTITAEQLFMIDQFVLKGGKLIVFVDPLLDANELPAHKYSNLAKLFDAWGVSMADQQVVIDRHNPLSVNLQGASGADLQRFTHLAWLTYANDAFNTSDIVTSNLNQVRIISAGAIEPKDGATTTFTPLVQTTIQANTTPATTFSQPPRRWFANYTAGGKRLAVVARVQGKASTAFPERIKTDDVAESTDAGINVLIFADTDFLLDRYWVNVQNFLGQQLQTRTADNGTLVINAVENLVGNNDLISLRSRGIKQRPFAIVNSLRQDAESKYHNEEQRLQDNLRQTEQRINSLQNNKEKQNALIISPEQQREISKFQKEQVRTRSALRSLQLNLNREIDSLGAWLKFFNIALIPLLVLLLAFFLPSRLGIKRS